MLRRRVSLEALPCCNAVEGSIALLTALDRNSYRDRLSPDMLEVLSEGRSLHSDPQLDSIIRRVHQILLCA